MRRYNSAFLGWPVFALSLSLVFSGLFASAYCQAVEVAVLIEQSPPKGGEVAGGTGVRYFPFGSTIRLTAVPSPGYHFLFWLGDVVDPQSINTVAHLDGPMVIVAVYAKTSEEKFFEREDMSSSIEMATRGEGEGEAGGGGGGVRAEEPTPPPSSFKAVGWVRRPPTAVILEPSTIFLFGLAAVMLRRKQRPF